MVMHDCQFILQVIKNGVRVNRPFFPCLDVLRLCSLVRRLAPLQREDAGEQCAVQDTTHRSLRDSSKTGRSMAGPDTVPSSCIIPLACSYMALRTPGEDKYNAMPSLFLNRFYSFAYSIARSQFRLNLSLPYLSSFCFRVFENVQKGVIQENICRLPTVLPRPAFSR
jgi:hypothetical protein